MVGSEFNRTRGKREQTTRGDWDLFPPVFSRRFFSVCLFVCLFFSSIFFARVLLAKGLEQASNRHLAKEHSHRAYIERETAIQKLQNSPRNYTLPDGASGNPYISHKFFSFFFFNIISIMARMTPN